MKQITAEVVTGIHALAKDYNVGLYVTVINAQGEVIACLKSGDVARASFTLSIKKAETAYKFNLDSDVIYQSLITIGQQNLLCEEYRFLAGGVISQNTSGERYGVGLSTNNPHLDKAIALNILSQL